jgi:hypothetical protein
VFKKYKKPAILLIIAFFIQFLGNPVPKHTTAEIPNSFFDYIILSISYVFTIIALGWILMLRNDKSD